jgi:AraC family transcriptional regulator of adaptative response/methylated-DNA-[protein]-cysteine methyltransferase
VNGQERLPTNDEWRAIAARNRRSDGLFVWVALTTNIYCRPSCPARRPPRHRTMVLGGPLDAERHGYSACRRCHPETTAPSIAEKSVAVALRYIWAHSDQPVILRDLTAIAGLSSNHFQQIFTRIVGVSPRELRNYRRLSRLKELLRRGDPISDASYAVGFGSSRALYETAFNSLGMTPATYRRGGAGVRVRYGTAGSALGRVLGAVTDRGVCAALCMAKDDLLVARLSRSLPGATLICDPQLSARVRKAVSACEPEAPLLSSLKPELRRSVMEVRIAAALSEGMDTRSGGGGAGR